MANHGRWEPQGDDALIELRAREVFTTRNPLVGQPSTSGTYGAKADNVAHPGPLGFVVLAPGTRLLGPVTGTLLSTAAVSAGALLTVGLLLFRVGGPRAGAAGTLLGALAAFSAGAGGLVDPLSSNFGRSALLAAAVGVWALLCGDVRSLPLTVAWWSFAAQQHLSVGPAAAILLAAGAVGVGLALWRPGEQGRRSTLLWVGGAAFVGLVLWGPVLYQQVTGDPGNLTALQSYSRDDARVDLGMRSAAAQVSRALGPVPFLGRSQPTGWQLTSTRPLAVVALVIGGLAVVLGLGAWWARRDRRFVTAVTMVGVLAVAGLLTGTNIPDSPEQGRLNFFHWAFALSFFELLALGWLVAKLAPVVAPKVRHGRASTAAIAAGAVLLGVAITPLVADRPSDRLGQPLPASVVRDLLDEVRASPELASVDGPVLVAVNGDDRYIQVGDTVGTRLAIDGRQVLFPASSDGFVHPSRIAADPCRVDHVLVVTLLRGEVAEPPGTEVARVDGAPGLDRAALDRLTAQAQAAPVEFGADLQGALDALPGDQGGFVGSTLAFRLPSRTDEVLLVRSNLDLLIDHPIASPRLDHDDLVALRDSLPEGAKTVVAEEVTAHLLDREQYAAFSAAC